MRITEWDDKEYVVFGTGNYGEKFAENKLDKVVLFLDNKVPYGEEVNYKDTNVKIVNPDFYFANIHKKTYIVIAIKEWTDIANYLEQKGRRFYFDYLPVTLMEYNTIDIGFFKIKNKEFEPLYWLKKFSNGKKIAACYGECHMTCYQKLLSSCCEFANKYIFVSMPTVNDYNNAYYDFISRAEIWEQCDLVILNENSDLDYLKGYNSNEILRVTRKDCMTIKVTPCFFKGYYPQIRENKGNVVEWHYFTWEDKNINKLISQNRKNECLTEIQRLDFYNKDRIMKYVDKCFKILIKAEESCDIKIADYIQAHYKERILFLSPTHPVNEILEEIASRILLKLGIDSKCRLENENALALHETPVYPSVREALGIQEDDRIICPGDDERIKVNFKEYIREYINKAYM